MDKTVKIRFRQKNGEMKEAYFDFVPLSKRHEYIKKERDLEERKDKDGQPIQTTADEYETLIAEFVASLFNDKTITAKVLLDGIDASDVDILRDIVRYRVLGFSKSEDQARKKAIQGKLLAGQNSTI